MKVMQEFFPSVHDISLKVECIWGLLLSERTVSMFTDTEDDENNILTRKIVDT